MDMEDEVQAAYEKRVSKLKNRLGSAPNATEMFGVCSKFNTLFVRPKICGAIQEYQTQVIDSVKEDIGRPHDKFSYPMSQLRDIPSIAGAIIWAKQIERPLLTYMKRVKDVLGRGWENYAEGSRLATDSNSFFKNLIPNQSSTNGNQSTDVYTLAVAFDPDFIVIFKEGRNLYWLGFNDVKKVCLSAVSLIESIRTYTQTHQNQMHYCHC
ncbi:dynein heavy chain, N-terminal region 1-domain-containing protein [Phakopsora pachyrhizi]|nr:dynein heavy chain, N-terminal region 1-domain-containing protein [Phakopsora pachyrhizi]